MHSTIVLDAVRRVARARPVLGVVLSIGPLSSKLSVEGQRGLGLVVGKLNSERAASRQFNGGIAGRRCLVAATVGLHPPLLEREVPERVDRSVGVGVVVARIRTTLRDEIRMYFISWKKV